MLVGRFLLAPPAAPGRESPASEGSVEARPTVWTCSMHPQIRQPDPGDCPICGMDLIPLTNESSDDNPRILSMSRSARALAEIETSPVRRIFPEMDLRLAGRIDYDETRLKSLTARFPARIDRLFVNYTGVPVRAGEHLGQIFSPELLTAQKELLSAVAADPDGTFARAAREKLRLWDLLPDQIESIVESGRANDRFILRAPIGGVVIEKKVSEGDYVETGQALFRIADFSRLWLFLDAYESDLTWLRFGQDVSFTVEAFPGETFHGPIAFIDPELNRTTRTVPVRVNVDNPDGRLKPGMLARGTVRVGIGADGAVIAPQLAGKWISPMHPEIVKDGPGQCDVCGMDLVPAEELGYVTRPDTAPPLVVPVSAVLRTGRRAVVYRERPDADRPTFEGREILLGPRAGNVFLVVEGLEEGDRVVTNGAFKIDSALQIQAQPSMMSPEGGAAGATHDHGAVSTRPEIPDTDAPALTLPELSAEGSIRLLDGYLALQEALAADRLDETRPALESMLEQTGHRGALPDLIHLMLDAGSLDAIRRPHFETLSEVLIAAIRADPAAFAGRSALLMHCPMVYPNRGADWIQAEGPLRNPYFGAVMLECGESRGNLLPDGPTETQPYDHEH